MFGPYHVKKHLGGGGMGTVYLVENTALGREEALKVPHFEDGDSLQTRERFLREARAAAGLDHPNLCPVYHVGVQDGVYFLTMRYLQGRPLSDYTDKPRLPRQAVEIVRTLARALEYAHGKGVIHRDLKPSNVMMCAGAEPVILDFGLAKRTRQQGRKLTQSGAALGTPAYMPPEQVKGELARIGPASDVYSLGVILYELLAGHPLFQGSSPAEVFAQVLGAEPPPPSALRPGLDPVLDAICLKALAKAPEQRYGTMTAFATALTDYLRAGPAAGAVERLPTAVLARLCQLPTVPPERAMPMPELQGGQAPAPAIPQRAGLPEDSAPTVVVAGAEEKRGGRTPGVLTGILGCLGLLLVGSALVGLGMAGLAALNLTSPSGGMPPPAPLNCTGEKGVSAAEVKKAQAAWARYLGRQVEEEDEVAPGVKMAFVLVPPGKFLMGLPKGEEGGEDDEEQHEVTLTRPFYLGKCEVTQAQYEAVVGQGNNPSALKGPKLPVETVSWADVSGYADRLTKKRGDGLVYRLPTEAEWEYSCRGGRPSSQPFGIGNGTALSSDQANFDGDFP
jgi:predicted Ser/Thr protein kinase